MNITWMGSASVLVEAAGERMLFDPFVQLLGGENPNTLEDFLEEENVFITHGQFDHLFYVPQIIENGDVTVFCTAHPAKVLEEFTEETGNILEIRPGNEFSIGAVRVKVLQGRYEEPEKRIMRRGQKLFRILRHGWNIPYLFYVTRKFRETGDAVAYEISAEGKTVLLLGSAGLSGTELYPKGADLLILPFTGNGDSEETVMKIVDRLQPKRIFLTHFDDAFPPVSCRADTRGLKQRMDAECPQVRVVKPVAGKRVMV